ncbi:MerR family transcriptional regulator [Photobacterium sanguinicancri]|uniref:MerR family transcriptional regulator n=1 Tax=Photobacterium sanguinicancri TaxID=875932 RepID=A0ABX4FXB5_9GAMM|nr:MerR family transcriptional regulator [Photobacterium sanguinicancri]
MEKTKDIIKTFSISELSSEFDITPRSIRFYEDQGLLSPARQGQQRIFSRQDRARLKLTLRGKRVGFSLSEMRELFELYDTENADEKHLSRTLYTLQQRQRTLTQQQTDLQAVQLELAAAEQRCYLELARRKKKKAD